MIDENECERMVIKYLLDKVHRRARLKPAMQKHNQKQAKVWQTKVPRKGTR
jgi:hypothetical protein